MSTVDKAKNKVQETKGLKEAAGKATDDRSLKAKGKKDKASGNLKQAGEKVKDAFRNSSLSAGASFECQTGAALLSACPTGHRRSIGETIMGIILLAILVVILFGAGFAVHLLWIAAVVLAIVWVASFALNRGEGASRRSLRR